MLEIGTLLKGEYRILSEIGRGGMSIVYLAINEKVNVTWAVKEIRDDGSNDYDIIIDGMKREIETLKHVKHPKIPKIIDVIEKDDSFIIIMDYVEGSSLDKILAKKGALKESDVVKWMIQVCDVLHYLHTRSNAIIHRDMKPANIMLNPETGNITVIDFGTAKQVEVTDNAGLTTCLGTPGYAAPEQYGGLGRTDAKTDIFALGMTMFALLTGIDPQKKLVVDTSIRKINPSLSSGLDEIILKCTERDASKRYASCAELLYALENYKNNDVKARKKKRIKLTSFAVTLFLSLSCAVSGLVFNLQAKSKATDTYEELIYNASMTNDYNEKIRIYKEAIDIKDKAGEKEAYLGLIRVYRENDDNIPVFTNDEASEIQKLIMKNREELEKNEEGYIEICYEIGKLYWYHYSDENQVTRAKYAIDWFQIVTSRTDENYTNYGLATVYQNIGIFYRDINSNFNEASDGGMYSDLFDNMQNLIDTVALDNSESEIVRLELIEMVRSALHRYSSQFKRDKVSEEEMLKLYDKLELVLDSVYVPEDENDKSYIKKEGIRSYMAETKSAITIAYETGNGGKKK